MSNRLTVLVNSCDSYSDVWDLFFEAFRVQWSQCPYKIVLNTESSNYQYKDMPITVHKFKRKFGLKDLWGKRYRETLRSIDTPYVLPILDDFVFTEPVNSPELLEEIMDFMDNNPDVVVVYLDAFPKWCFILEESDELPGFGKMPQCCSYKLSTAIAVWRREKLLSLIKDFETPWEWEMNASYRACLQEHGRFYAAMGGEDEKPVNIMFKCPFGGAIRRGLWNVNMNKVFNRYGLQMDTSIRGIMDESNPYKEVKYDTYSLKQSVKTDFYKTIFWKNAWKHLLIKINNLYNKYRFFKSLL